MPENLAQKKCVPCEDGVPPLTPRQAGELLKQLSPEWMLVDSGRLLARSFTFKNFKQTMAFVNRVADIAEAEGHHPDMSVGYGTLGIELTTHAIDGLSENDFILAAKIDAL
jgi:4a-hydroxytetrahydrobiopterin dehydratase